MNEKKRAHYANRSVRRPALDLSSEDVSAEDLPRLFRIINDRLQDLTDELDRVRREAGVDPLNRRR